MSGSDDPPDETSSRSRYHLTLDDPQAMQSHSVGGKAAALARVRSAGVVMLPGVVLTAGYSEAVDAGEDVDAALTAAYHAASSLSERADAALIVRSSSVVEDQSESSAAGQFESVADVVTAEDFRRAVATVLGSRASASIPDAPIGVLVQPQVEPQVGGVVFGVEPVTGRTDRLVVAVSRGRPDRLVGGEVDGTRYVVDGAGSVVDAAISEGVELDDEVVREVVESVQRLADVFGAPQDVEWAVVDGTLTVLQSRPVTSPIRGVPSGPQYGPGTLAETFPEPLSPLELNLWTDPLDEAIRAALVLAARNSEEELSDRRLVIAVGGRVALDLDVTEEVRDADEAAGGARRGWVVRRWRRLRNAWRIGRLRAALPALVDDLLTTVDADLAGLPQLEELSTRRCLAVLHRSQAALRSLHAHEVLVGAVVGTSSASLTAASVALRALDGGRRDGLADDAIVERAPVVLALVPPRIGPTAQLPHEVHVPTWDEPDSVEDDAVRREALRLRVRWIHELTARLAWQVGERLAERGELPDAAAMRHLPLADVDAIVGRRASAWWSALEAAESSPPSDRLPARFRLGDRGLPIPESDTTGDAVGASPGTATGVAVHLDDRLDERLDELRRNGDGDGAILVTRALRPDLGSRLASLAGIVSEGGSTLSHLAILAREQRLPVVVGCTGAVDRFPPGARLRVDGAEGTVAEHGGRS